MKSGAEWIWIKTVGAEEAPRNGARCIGILDSKHSKYWKRIETWKTQYFSVWVICCTCSLVRCHFSVISIKELYVILCRCYSWSCVPSHSLTQQTCWNVRSPSTQCFNMALGHVLGPCSGLTLRGPQCQPSGWCWTGTGECCICGIRQFADEGDSFSAVKLFIARLGQRHAKTVHGKSL